MVEGLHVPTEDGRTYLHSGRHGGVARGDRKVRSMWPVVRVNHQPNGITQGPAHLGLVRICLQEE